MHDDDATIFRAVQAGARGCVVKTGTLGGARRDPLGGARGRRLLRRAGRRLTAWFAGLGGVRTTRTSGSHLARVLELISRGRGDNAGIGAVLGVSPKTVRNLVSNVFTKLQVTDRAAAATRAREAGLS